MSWKGRSLLSIEELSTAEVNQILSLAKSFKDHFYNNKSGFLTDQEEASRKVVSEVFFETSTRTRLSFQMACHRLGVRVHGMDLLSGSSVKKGESITETIETIAAMGPDLMVVRSGGTDDVEQCLRNLAIPAINAGAGTSGHPSQALLDLFTLLETKGDVSGLKLLFVGDVRHSRVANSNLALMSKYSVELAYCAPDIYAPKESAWQGVQRFVSLAEGLKWCDIVMGLRIQMERHEEENSLPVQKYVEGYRLDASHLQSLSPTGIVMHPGPFLPGVDLSPEVLADPRCVIRGQVAYGVYIRMAALALLLGLEVPL